MVITIVIFHLNAKGVEKWKKMSPCDRRKWAEFLAHMVKYFKRQLTKTGGGTMGQEEYGTSIHTMEELTDRDLLMEAVTKYVEREKQVEERMAQME